MDVCYVISRFQCINVLCACERDVSVQAAVSVCLHQSHVHTGMTASLARDGHSRLLKQLHYCSLT